MLFAGVQNNVPDYMNAFDLFLLPSNFEGSPVTLVEAQGCGVPCLASTNVPGDGSVTELVHFLPLSAPFEEWAKTADSIAPGGPHADYWPTLAAAGYELKNPLHTAWSRCMIKWQGRAHDDLRRTFRRAGQPDVCVCLCPLPWACAARSLSL